MPVPKHVRVPAAETADPLAALPAPMRVLAQRGEIRHYRKGTLLIQEGDQGDTLYIVVSGRLRAFSAGLNGREITYGVHGPGETLGEMGLDGGPRSVSVITLEDSQCVVLTRHSLAAHLSEHPQFAFDLLSQIICKARAVTESARQLALHDVYGRLKLLLESMMPAEGPPTGPIGDRLTHQDMAHRIGCSREMVSRLLKDLERGGFIEQGPDGLQVLRRLPAGW